MLKNRFRMRIFIFLILIFHLTLCSGEKKTSAESGSDAKIPADNKINETALFFAGSDIPVTSPLNNYVKTKFYSGYAKDIRTGWNRFQQPNLNAIRAWWQKHSPAKIPSAVLYPFSGPDIMNALTFFPDAEKYIMFGLEPPGRIPDPHGMNSAEITAGLNGLKRSLNSIYHVNFFKTKNMAVEIGNKSFNTIGGLIIFFLSLNGYTIIDAKKIVIDENSNLAPGTEQDENINWTSPPKSRVPGIEITFMRKGGKKQIIRYFMLNVIDQALKKSSPNFIPYIAKEGRYASVIKSASYLMHNDTEKFTKILDGVLSSTDFLVQDDSGIPLRQFTKGQWILKFHGYYDRPIPLFAHRMQRDLKAEMDSKSTGILPFSYGYDYQPGKSNLMTAERVKTK